jgi:hypothetical protein
MTAMTWTIGTAFVALAGWALEWGQRRCEEWAQTHDKDL